MEDINIFIIPTRSKAKISHELSYPIGAERISIALASVVQLAQLVLHFKSDRFNQVRFGQSPFLDVTYKGKDQLERLAKMNLSNSAGIPLWNRWEIEVKPVPRILRHRIHQYILDSALPQIKQWLDQRANLAQEGSDKLSFFFNEQKDEFESEQLGRPQPIRAWNSGS